MHTEWSSRLRSFSLTALFALSFLDNAAASTVAVPMSVGGQAVVQVATGQDHTCAVTATGEVWCWGRNEYGQLGDGTTLDRLTPVRVSGLSGALQVAVGSEHSCALRNSGRVFCWGSNSNGLLGNGPQPHSSTPVRVLRVTNVTQIAVGSGHSCALSGTGEVQCWGNNWAGQLGDGTTWDRQSPVRVLGPAGQRAVEVVAGGAHSCARLNTGRVFCWGFNRDGQLGDGTDDNHLVPVRVRNLSNVAQISAGGFHTCALRSNGRVFCWGNNVFGALGDGGSWTQRLEPVRVVGLTMATQIAAGSLHSCALRESQRVFCWGYNGFGGLGDGTDGVMNSRGTPARVLSLSGAMQVAAGSVHTCAVQEDGDALCWGGNFHGQLGDGTAINRPRPVSVAE